MFGGSNQWSRRWRSGRRRLRALVTRTHRRVEPTQRMVEAIAAGVRFRWPARKLHLIGVTGTDGKTTTCHMVAEILAAAGHRAAVHSTIEGHADSGLTTPNPWVLHGWFRRIVDDGAEWAVVEVSSHALVLNRIWGLHFDAVAVTNVSWEHLDFHRSMPEYVAAKTRLFRGHPAVAVVNCDDPWRARFESFAAGLTVKFGFGPDAEVTATDVDVSSRTPRFNLVTPGGATAVQLRTAGEFNILNALAAAAVAFGLGVQSAATATGLERFAPVAGRLEWIDAGQPFGVVVDYAHTPNGMEQLYRALRPLTAGRLITVFGAGGNRDRGKRPMLGAVAAAACELIVLTSDSSRYEDPQRIAQEIEEGVTSLPKWSGRYLIELDRRRAIELALAAAGSDDTVVIAGKGPDPWGPYGEKSWTDPVVIREVLHSMFAGPAGSPND